MFTSITSIDVATSGNVEARVMCFYRRSEIPASLVPLADKHHWGEVVDTMDGGGHPRAHNHGV